MNAKIKELLRDNIEKWNAYREAIKFDETGNRVINSEEIEHLRREFSKSATEAYEYATSQLGMNMEEFIDARVKVSNEIKNEIQNNN